MVDGHDRQGPLGQRLWGWRTGAGLSVEAAARRAGISPTTWRKAERGDRVRDLTLARLSDVLDVDQHELRRMADH